MEKLDEDLARRVWQRVQQAEQPAPDTAALAALMGQELADASVCITLSRRLGGKGGVLLKLAREDQAHAGCLRGICTVAAGNVPEFHTPAPAAEQTQSALRKCYVNHLSRLREYESRTGCADFGPAFEKLAAEERSHCAILLELIGTL